MRKVFWAILTTILGTVGTCIWWIVKHVYASRLIESISGTTVDPIVRFFASPFEAVLNTMPRRVAGHTPQDFAKWRFIGETAAIEAVWLIGIIAVLAMGVGLTYNRFARSKIRIVLREFAKNQVGLLALEEIGATVALIDEKRNEDKIDDATIGFIDNMIGAFRKGVESIFGVRQHEYRYYWLVFSKSEDGKRTDYDAVTTGARLDENDEHVIKSMLTHPDKKRKRFFHMSVDPEYYENYGVTDALYLSNEGEPRLALLLFIYKYGAVTKASKDEFRRATVMLGLLGHVAKLPAYVVAWGQKKQGGGA